MQPFNKIRSDVKQQIEKLTGGGFQQIFNHIDQLGIKKGVDRYGIDKFIEHCAWMAAGTGVISGSGGLFTMLVGIPVDFVNLITQQFRITMAIMYHQRGTYQIDFQEFMSLVAASLKVEASVAITKTVLEGIAEKLLAIFGTRVAERLIPVVGAAIGGTANYLFVKRMAKMVKKMQLEPMVVVVE